VCDFAGAGQRERSETADAQCSERGLRIMNAPRYCSKKRLARLWVAVGLFVTESCRQVETVPYLMPCSSSPAPGSIRRKEEIGPCCQNRGSDSSRDGLHSPTTSKARGTRTKRIASRGLRGDAAERRTTAEDGCRRPRRRQRAIRVLVAEGSSAGATEEGSTASTRPCGAVVRTIQSTSMVSTSAGRASR